MSSFLNYEAVASDYDQIRRPIGVDIVAAYVREKTGKTLQEIHLLDAGCGSGQYAEELLKQGLGRITLLDASAGMLKHAKKRVEPFIQQGQVAQILEHKLPTLPFPDHTFDVVMINQVLHHLTDDVTQESSAVENGLTFTHPGSQSIKTLLQEVYRILKKGGIFVLDTATPEQITGGIWYSALAPSDASERYAKRFPPLSMLRKFVIDSGFSTTCTLALLDNIMFNEQIYNDVLGPTNADWRGCDSFWGYLTPDELQSAVDKVHELKRADKLNEFFRQREEIRLACGQSVKMFSVKSC